MEKRTNSVAEIQAKKALNLRIFSGFDLDNAKDKLTKLLSHVGSNEMFSEYTKHDISHVDGMLNLLDFIIPDKTRAVMTPTDWMMIVLSFYFHDLGMLITQSEFDDRSKDYRFNTYKNDKLDLSKYSMLPDEKREKYIYQDYVRDNHGNRIESWLVDIANGKTTENPVVKVLRDVLCNIDPDFLKDLGKVCKSHSEPFSKVSEFDVRKPYEQARDSEVNLLFAAAILRTTDLLHVNSERTPDVDFAIISPKDSYSRREWVKQRAVKRIRPKNETDKDGNVDTSIEPHLFEVIASFNDEDAYSHFMDYLSYAEEEIKITYQICKLSSDKNKNGYIFPWDGICRNQIRTEGFNAEKLKFELDKDNILKLLIGHTLYNQANVVLRELAQNSIDACRLMNYSSKSGSDKYQPQVRIEWNKEKHILKVSDNGTGMNEDIIKKYLLKVGSSRYQSKEFQDANKNFHSISRFGIGLLTCFMISDDFEVITLWHEEDKAHRLKIKNIQGEYMLRNDVEPIEILDGRHGSTFILNVHQDINLDNIIEDLRRWIIIPNCNVTVIENDKATKIGYESCEDALKDYLAGNKINVDDKQYKLLRKSNDDVEIYFLLCKHPLYKDSWSLYLPNNDLPIDNDIPIGICIEGVMVSNYTPGFLGRNYIVLVNCRGKKSPKTNVARDGLESSQEQLDLLRFIYKSYLDIVGDQISYLSKEYSLSWALGEAQRNIDSMVRQRNFQNKELFDDVLHAYECNLVDTGERYINKSISNFGEEIWTIESKAYSSAERLVQEISNCDKTALSLFQSLDTKFNRNGREIFSETLTQKYTTDLFLKKYEVVEIQIFENNRRMEFCWHRGNSKWKLISGNLHFLYYSIPNMYILTDIDDVKINIKGYDIIISRYGMFFISDHPLRKYLLKILDSADSNKTCTTIISYIYYLNRKRKVHSEDSFRAFSSSDEDYFELDMWEYINIEELNQMLSQTLKFLDYNIYYMQQDQ